MFYLLENALTCEDAACYLKIISVQKETVEEYILWEFKD